ncbi:MAG: hypothetical protein WBW74_15380 [Xanthobacteraceae bacterium]
MTRMEEEKHPLAARTTTTCAAGCELVSARPGSVIARSAAMTRAALAAVIVTGTKAFMVYTRIPVHAA